MSKALDDSHATDVHSGDAPRRRKCDWRKSMSDNVAYALLVYTTLQIFVTTHALQQGLPSIFPYLLLVLLVAGIIPACRWFERRWSDLSDGEAANTELRSTFRRDQIMLWALAILLPIVLTFCFKGLFALT